MSALGHKRIQRSGPLKRKTPGQCRGFLVSLCCERSIKLIIESDAHDMVANVTRLRDCDERTGCHIRDAAEIQVEIFKLYRPRAGKANLDAATNRPLAYIEIGASLGLDYWAGDCQIIVNVRPSGAARHVDQPRATCVAKPPSRGRK